MIAPLAGFLLIAGASAAAAQTLQEEPEQVPVVRPPAKVSPFITLSVDRTTSLAGNRFERVLLAPPEEDSLTPGGVWEIDMTQAVELAAMAPDERWQAIRRNLGLSPEAGKDFLLWTELVDALLIQLNELTEGGRNAGTAGYGLRVAFPGKDPDDRNTPDVALTFDSGKTHDRESLLMKGLVEAMTGVEGFVRLRDPEGNPVEGDWLSDHPGLELRLLDRDGKTVASMELKNYPYYCFPRLPGVSEWGSDFRLVLAEREKGPLRSEPESGEFVPAMEARYVPVRQGLRTRLDIELDLIRAARPQMEEIQKERRFGEPKSLGEVLAGAPVSVDSVVGSFVSLFPPLGTILGALPPNPGLHFGVVQTEDAGPQLFFSARFKFKAEVPDRGPRFVSKGTIRLQVMTAEGAGSGTPAHYLKVVWCGRAGEADLSLSSRPIRRFPLGLGIGIVPSMSPDLYSAGLSYKVLKGLELYAGVGFRSAEDDVDGSVSRTSLVYGVTLDLESVIDLISRAVGKEDQ